MKKFYFTFGREGDTPYHDGWVEVMAPSFDKAIEKYEGTFGKRRYSFCYPDSTFEKLKMFTDGNFGKKCHARLIDGIDHIYEVEA